MRALTRFQLQALSAAVLAFAISPTAFGQTGRFQNHYASRIQQQRSSTTTTPAMQFFGNGHRPRPTNPQVRNLLPVPQPVQVAGAKPFTTLERGATLSPYLGLDLLSSETSLPNYHAFVRPNQQQQQLNLAQAAQVRRLKQQLRVATAQGIVSNNPSGGVPTTGASAQFLNMGGYFPATK